MQLEHQKQLHLNDLQPGDTGVIDCLHFNEDYKRRLCGMGLRCDDRITCIRRASWGGPMHIRVGSTDLMLRLKEASLICLK